MRFWKERMKIRMNGFGTLGDCLGMGSCDASLQFSLTGTGTAEESDRYMLRIIIPYRGANRKSLQGMRPAVSYHDKERTTIYQFI